MKGLPEDRAVQFARYIIEAGATVRETAKEFHISKSTVHKDIQERLPLLNYPLYREVRVVLDRNKEERHLRGGAAPHPRGLRKLFPIYNKAATFSCLPPDKIPSAIAFLHPRKVEHNTHHSGKAQEHNGVPLFGLL